MACGQLQFLPYCRRFAWLHVLKAECKVFLGIETPYVSIALTIQFQDTWKETASVG